MFYTCHTGNIEFYFKIKIIVVIVLLFFRTKEIVVCYLFSVWANIRYHCHKNAQDAWTSVCNFQGNS